MRTAYSEHRLPNGLTIIAEIDPGAHTMAAGYFVRTGGRDEPSRLMGVSHFLEHMMFKGSASVVAQDVNRRFDAIGAEHNAFTTIDMTAYHAHVLPDRQSEAISLLSDLLRPALRGEDFDEERKVILEEIAMYDDNPFWPLYERAAEAFHGGNPLGHRVLGTPESIQAMDVGSMRDYFTARYSPDNTVLALAGKVDLDAAIRTAEAELGMVPPQSPRPRDTMSSVWRPAHQRSTRIATHAWSCARCSAIPTAAACTGPWSNPAWPTARTSRWTCTTIAATCSSARRAIPRTAPRSSRSWCANSGRSRRA
jgi:predicted Zn-dependent peptidase